jgi:hypothetical protein
LRNIRNQPDRNPATRIIIAVDGEGWNIPLSPGVTSVNPHAAGTGWHSYVMLAGASDTGHNQVLMHDGSRREATETQARNYGLSTRQCCEFLLSLPKDALLVSFYFNYDATKIYGADLPLANLRELCNENHIPQPEYERRVRAIASQYGYTVKQIHDWKIVDTGSTVYDGYWIRHTPRKSTEIIDLSAGREEVYNRFRDKTGQWRVSAKPEMKWCRAAHVWDVFGFFQKAFVKALADYRCGTCGACKAKPQEHCVKALWSAAELLRMTQMKADRSAFDPSRAQEIAAYCVDECRYLSFLVRDLLTQVKGFDEKLYARMRNWDGSGAIAGAWMSVNDTKQSLPARDISNPAEPVPEFTLAGLPESIALSAYFGGRFEISEMGYMGTLYGYDINSAYPAITVNLPCLAHGRFRRLPAGTDGLVSYQAGRTAVYLAGSRTAPDRALDDDALYARAQSRFAPFPFRTDDSGSTAGVAKDAIYYCHGGKRWIWQDEIAAARKHYGADAIPLYDGWLWEAEPCDCNPFASIPDMYKTRQEYVIIGNGIEKVIKLILNSLYGKTAQSIGWNIDAKGIKNPPPFQCFIWAGLITSGCRAMILDAIMQPDADVVSIATDGILSRTEITGIPAPKEKILGQWEAGKAYDAYCWQSGVYAYFTDKGKRKYATRGFSAREIQAEQLIAAWITGQETVSANPTESRFIPMKSGILRDGALEYIGQWIPSIHDVSFTHNRREPILTDDIGAGPQDAPRSLPHVISDDVMSTAYSPRQTWEDVMENQPVSDECDYQED